MRSMRVMVVAGFLAAALTGIVLAQVYDAGTELGLVEKLMQARDSYKASLNDVYNFYLRTGDMSNAKRAERELKAYNAAEHYNYATKPGVVGGPAEKPTNVVKFEQMAEDYYIDGKMWADSIRKANKDIALQRFEKILSTWPDSDKAAPAAYAMGEIYSSLGYRDFDLAASYFRKAFDLDPQTPLPALVKAGNCYLEVSRWDDARRMYNQALESSRDPKAREEASIMLARMARIGH